MSTKSSSTTATAPPPATVTSIARGSEARVAWGWRRIEHLCQLYVDGDPLMARLAYRDRPPHPDDPGVPFGEGVSLATAMAAGIPLEPVRELWAKAKAHMVALEAWKAENAMDAEGGPAA
jgi:hypothetical protein